MKKIFLGLGAMVMVFALSGCDIEYHDDDEEALTTLFLVDQYGHSYEGIPYRCDSMNYWEHTPANGEFSFLEPEKCEFDFSGLEGNYDNSPSRDDIIYIIDYYDHGKGGIAYECEAFGVSSTYGDGSFEYDRDDRCLFYL